MRGTKGKLSEFSEERKRFRDGSKIMVDENTRK